MEFHSMRPRQRVSSCCKKFAAFLFSQVGLATMVVAYSIMGGFLFRAIEGPYEEDLKAEVRVFRELKVDEAWKMLTEQFGNVTVWNKTQFVEELMRIFVDFQDNIAKAVKEKGWDGKDESGEQWSFPGALLYAVTVITTIGYGHIAPKTNLGRFVTILYALVGIPLTFLYLSTIGNFLAHCFRIFYKKICCDICCCLKCERTKRRQTLMQRRQRLIDQSSYSDRSDLGLQLTATTLLESPSLISESNKRPTVSSTPKITTNPIANTYIAMETGQVVMDGYGQGVVSTTGGVRLGENWVGVNAGSDIRGSGKPRLPTTSALAPRLRTVASAGNNVRDDRVLYGISTTSGSSCSQGDSSKGRKGKKWKNRSRSVEDAVPRTPVSLQSTPISSQRTLVSLQSTPKARLQSTPTRFKASKSGRSLSLESKAVSCVKTDVAKDTSDLKRSLTTSTLTSALKRTAGGVRSDKVSEKSSRKRKRLWRSLENTAKLKPATLTNGRKESREEKGGEKKAEGGSGEREVEEEEGEMKGKRELGATGERLADDERGSEETYMEANMEADVEKAKEMESEMETDKEIEMKIEMENECKDTAIGNRDSASSVERSAFFERSLRSATHNGSEESFVTATEDAPLYDDIYQSTSCFDRTTSVPHLPIRAHSRRSKNGGEPMSSPKTHPPLLPQIPADCQRLAKNNVRIRFGASEFSPESHMEYDDDDEDEDTKHSKIRVPIYVCLIVITSYILAGSVLFTLWEDWDLLTGSYFCFITLSTIGFGDIVPGTDMDKWDSSEKLVLCALWLALGLSLLAMCFNLMQEEVKEKCKWIAIKCGLIRNETKL